MRILGIDCGSQVTGYGVLESDGRRHRLVEYGTIRTSARDPFAARLKTIYRGIQKVFESHSPEAIAVETAFHGVNPKSALQLAHVRGVALLSGAEAGLGVGEYSPLEVKASVVGYGRASKEQVQMMVASLLALKEPIRSADAADALAVAICHATRIRMNAATKRRGTIARGMGVG